tara:strand:- start:2346 stop:2456 length:111 start_codon:yes stop_codon:yes gene_type:complete
MILQLNPSLPLLTPVGRAEPELNKKLENIGGKYIIK